MNQLPGNYYKYRLPTEQEWEYAAAFQKNYPYSGTGELEDVAFYRSNSNRRTHKVGSKKANRFGLYDMSGNVYEWCDSWYETLSTHEMKVIRGGSWQSKSNKCKIKSRSKANPNDRMPIIGFRLVK